MATLKLAPNLPVRLAVKYVDAVPPNDPKYGPQTRLKMDNGDLLYLNGKASDTLTELYQKGVIAEIPSVLPTVPGQDKVNVKLRPGVKDVTLTLEQPAGEKYGTVRVAGGNGAPPPAQQPSPASPAPYVPPPQETGAPPASSAHVGHIGGQPARGGMYTNPLYVSIVEFVCRDIVPVVQNGSGLRMTSEAISAMVAQVWIQECKQ